MTRATSRVVVTIAAALALGMVIPATAGAQTASDLRAKAARIERQIQANGDRIAALGEQFNGAQLKLQQLQGDQVRAVRQFKAAEKKTHSMRASVAALAARLYMSHSGGSAVVESVDVTNVMDYTRNQQYTAATADKDFAILDRLRDVQIDLSKRRHTLAKSISAARVQRDRLSATRAEIESANATATRLLNETKGELGRLVRAEEQRQEAAAASAARKRAAADESNRNSGSSSSPQGPDTPLPPAPPPSDQVAKVIAYARAQIGKPYRTNASGPDAFDCSGLTMMAWAAGGVSMPHYSGAQYAMFPHVSLSDLQPGDLLFKGPGGSSHVSLYVGGGMNISATHTGSYVLLQAVVYSHLSGAARPG